MKRWVPSLVLLGSLAAYVAANEVKIVCFTRDFRIRMLTRCRNKTTTTDNDVLACTARKPGEARSTPSYSSNS